MFPSRKYRKYKIRTRLTPSDITSRLKESSEIFGDYQDSHFTFRKRISPYMRNSFFAVVKGSFEKDGEHTVVDVTMRMSAFVIAFLVEWLVFVTIGLAVGIVLLASGDINNGLSVTLCCSGMILIEQLLQHVPFYFDAKWNINFLNQLLEAGAESVDEI